MIILHIDALKLKHATMEYFGIPESDWFKFYYKLKVGEVILGRTKYDDKK